MRWALALAFCTLLAACSTMKSTPPQAYVVFFAGSSVAMPPEAATIISNAAADAQLHPMDRVEVSGPSTKAAAGYNPAAAESRIAAVERALVSAGVNANRLIRTSLETGAAKVDAAGAQRVEIRMVDAPRS